jgi:hypothetical protein
MNKALEREEGKGRRSERTDLDKGRLLLRSTNPRLEHLLVVLRPSTDRKLGDLDGRIIDALDRSGTLVAVLVTLLDGTLCVEEVGEDGSASRKGERKQKREKTVKEERRRTHPEPTIPRVHRLHLLAIELPPQVRNDVGRVVVRNERGPSRADTVGTVDENHGENGDVPASREGSA